MTSFVPMTPPFDQRPPVHLRNDLIALIDAIMSELDQPGILAFSVRLGQHLGIRVEGVAMNDGLRKTDVIESQLLQCILDAILRSETENHGAVDAAIRQGRAPGRGLHFMLVEVSLGGIHHEVGDEHVLEQCDGFAAAMLVDSPDREILEIVVMAGQLRRLRDHAAPPGLRRRIRLARRKPTIRLPWLSKPSVRQVTMPFLGSLPDSRFSTVVLLAATVVPG